MKLPPPRQAKPPEAPPTQPSASPGIEYRLAGLKKTPTGWVTVVASFVGMDLVSLETFGPPELKEFATGRLIRRMRSL